MPRAELPEHSRIDHQNSYQPIIVHRRGLLPHSWTYFLLKEAAKSSMEEIKQMFLQMQQQLQDLSAKVNQLKSKTTVQSETHTPPTTLFGVARIIKLTTTYKCANPGGSLPTCPAGRQTSCTVSKEPNVTFSCPEAHGYQTKLCQRQGCSNSPRLSTVPPLSASCFHPVW